MYSKSVVLGIYSVSPIHAGSGAEVSVIDLPIQRERHTGFPVIWGQSLKGVLRSEFRDYELDMSSESGKTLREAIKEKMKEVEEALNANPSEDEKKRLEVRLEELKELLNSPPITTAIFGPPTKRASDHAGAIAVGDAKVLLFPVRSAKGVFAYVTCPLVLRRFLQDIELARVQTSLTEKVIDDLTPKKEHAVVSGRDSAVDFDSKVVLEDIVLTVDEEDRRDLSILARELENLMPSVDELEKRLVIVHDDVFKAFVRLSTEVVARVAIDPSTGTVKQGHLWYEEFLPRDTLMYSVIAIGNPKVELENADDVKKHLEGFFRVAEGGFRYLQIGGDETVGKGFAAARLWG